jgi:hypothetical protein
VILWHAIANHLPLFAYLESLCRKKVGGLRNGQTGDIRHDHVVPALDGTVKDQKRGEPHDGEQCDGGEGPPE